MCRGQGLAGGKLGLVGVGREELALDVMLAIRGVSWLEELKQLSEALIFHDGHWLQVTHNHLSYSLGDQNLQETKKKPMMDNVAG